jgi:hypothetical protein
MVHALNMVASKRLFTGQRSRLKPRFAMATVWSNAALSNSRYCQRESCRKPRRQMKKDHVALAP